MKLVLEEGEPVFMNADIIAQYNLKAGMTVPAAALEEMAAADTARKARERALYLLDFRDYSYAEMVKKLTETYGEDLAFDVADELAAKGLINDRRYAGVLARRLCEGKLLGYFRAKPYMREKGLPAALIERALAEYTDSAPERAAQLARKKYMRYFDPEDRDLLRKLKAALVRSGYSFSEASAAIDILTEEEQG